MTDKLQLQLVYEFSITEKEIEELNQHRSQLTLISESNIFQNIFFFPQTYISIFGREQSLWHLVKN